MEIVSIFILFVILVKNPKILFYCVNMEKVVAASVLSEGMSRKLSKNSRSTRKIEPKLVTEPTKAHKTSRFLNPFYRPAGAPKPVFWKIECGLMEDEAMRLINSVIEKVRAGHEGDQEFVMPFRVTSMVSRVVRKFYRNGSQQVMCSTQIRISADKDFPIEEVSCVFSDCDVEAWVPSNVE